MEKSPSKVVSSDETEYVEWDGLNDAENIRSRSRLARWCMSLIFSIAAFQYTANSSVLATSTSQLEEKFHTSREWIVCGTAFWVGSLIFSPAIAGPLSETFGRRPVYIVTYIGYLVFQFPSVFAPNVASLLVGRFLCALLGGSALSNTPASINDLWGPHDVSFFLNLSSAGAFIGPSVGPLVGGFANLIGVRWPLIVMIISSAVLCALICLVPETYEPKLKAKKARRLREKGQLNAIALFEVRTISFTRKMTLAIQRPALLIIHEPMLCVLCFYHGFVLAIQYCFTVIFPIVFQEIYGFTEQQVGLSFLGITVGMAIAAASVPLWDVRRRAAIAANQGMELPEMRLPPMCLGSILIPTGLFMFAWTIYPSVHWIVPIVASGLFGMGCYYIFSCVIAYIVAAYPMYAASATSVNVSIRCLMAGAFPLFSAQMLKGLTNHWCFTFLAIVGVLLAPSPFVLLKYGPYLRSKSTFARGDTSL